MTPRNDFSPAGMLFKSVVAAAGALLAAYLIWKLRSLIVPVAVSSLTAYICRPLVTRLERYRVPRGLGIWLLLFVFVLAALFIANRVRSIMPTEIGAIELKVRAIYKINEGYKNLMGLDQSLTRGNWIYRLAHDELDPIVDRINRLLALTPEEHAQFLASRPRGPEAPAGSDRLLDYYRANLQTLKVREPAALPQTGAVRAAPPAVAADADTGLEDAYRNAGPHPFHLDHSTPDLPIPAAGHRRDQARPSQSGPQPSVRTGANGPGRSRPRAG